MIIRSKAPLCINEDILQNKRTDYGKQIGRKVWENFEAKNLHRNGAVCRKILLFGNCRATGATIELVSFSETYTDYVKSWDELLYGSIRQRHKP